MPFSQVDGRGGEIFDECRVQGHSKGSSYNRMVRSPPSVLYLLSLTYPSFPLSESLHLSVGFDNRPQLSDNLSSVRVRIDQPMISYPGLSPQQNSQRCELLCGRGITGCWMCTLDVDDDELKSAEVEECLKIPGFGRREGRGRESRLEGRSA